MVCKQIAQNHPIEAVKLRVMRAPKKEIIKQISPRIRMAMKRSRIVVGGKQLIEVLLHDFGNRRALLLRVFLRLTLALRRSP